MLNMAWSPNGCRVRETAGKNLSPRRLNASPPDVVTKGPNENRLLIAFSIEKNSGIDGGDPAEPTAFVALADQARFSRQ
jgi:hypothetical protein